MLILAEMVAKGNQDGGSGIGLLIAGLFVLFCYSIIFGDKKKKK